MMICMDCGGRRFRTDPIYVSPRYLQLLALAMELEHIKFSRIDDFGDFLTRLLDRLKAGGHEELHKQILVEEAMVVSWGISGR